MLGAVKPKRTSMKFAAYDAVPPWARFLTLDEFGAFLAAIEHDLRARRLPFEDREGVLHVALPDGQIAQCGLAGLALKCGAVKPDAYAREAAAHFDLLFGQTTEPPPFPPSFEEVRSIVKLRLYTDEHFLNKGVKVVARPLVEGLQTVVVYDLPNLVATMSPDHLLTWKVSPDEAFRAAFINTEREPAQREEVRLGSVEAFSLSGESGFGASKVLSLESYLPPSKFGAIVAAPSRHALLCYPIRPSTVLEALRELVPYVNDLYQDGLDERSKLSPNLFWWRKEGLSPLHAGVDRGGLRGAVVTPPQEFVDTVLAEAETPDEH